jgi:pimeloyl-ACP methyl ester carboxylesterase
VTAERPLAFAVGGRRLAAHEWGEPDGVPLVHWHGLGTRAGLHVNEVAPILSERYGLRVIAPDAPGFGGSEPSPHLSPASLGDLVAGLLDVLGLERVAYSGWSWGATVGCQLAARHPHRLTALMLLDAGYADPDPAEPVSLDAVHELWEAECAPDRGTLVERLRTAGGRWSDAIEAAFLAGRRESGGRLEPVTSPETFALAFASLRDDPPSAAWPRMAAGAVPTLLVAADTAGEAELERFRAAVPRATIVRLRGAGHDVCRDQPDQVATAMGEWLTALPAHG